MSAVSKEVNVNTLYICVNKNLIFVECVTILVAV